MKKILVFLMLALLVGVCNPKPTSQQVADEQQPMPVLNTNMAVATTVAVRNPSDNFHTKSTENV